MAQPIDFGGQDLYVNNVYQGVQSPGLISAQTPGANQTGTADSTGTLLAFDGPFNLLAKGVNFGTATTDAAQVLFTLPTGVTKFCVDDVVLFNASSTLTGATFGIYNSAGASNPGNLVLSVPTAIAVSSAAGASTGTAQHFVIPRGAGSTTPLLTTFCTVPTANTANTMFIRVQSSATGTADMVIRISPLE